MGNLREHKGQTYLTYLLYESRTPVYAIVFRCLVLLIAECFLSIPNFNLQKEKLNAPFQIAGHPPPTSAKQPNSEVTIRSQ